jgi:hypothetical protein
MRKVGVGQVIKGWDQGLTEFVISSISFLSQTEWILMIVCALERDESSRSQVNLHMVRLPSFSPFYHPEYFLL